MVESIAVLNSRVDGLEARQKSVEQKLDTLINWVMMTLGVAVVSLAVQLLRK